MASQSVLDCGAVTIFSGDRLIVHRGGGKSDNFCNLLPMGVAASIEKVHREKNLEALLEEVIVLFKNGHKATMYLIPHLDDPVNDKLLQEFQARCLMIHDL